MLFSHHTLETLINDFAPDGAVRHLGGELAVLLGRFPNVVAWLNGHTHLHAVTPVSSRERPGGGFWQVTTASHVDWPQQARVVELAVDEETGDVVVVAAAIDHAGLLEPREGELTDPVTLAGWSRELALNAWQGRGNTEEPGGSGALEPFGRGAPCDRNVMLVVPAPFPLGGDRRADQTQEVTA